MSRFTGLVLVLMTMATAIVIPHASNPSTPIETSGVVRGDDSILVEPEVGKLVNKAPDTNVARRIDLSIAIQVSEPTPNPPSYKWRDIKLGRFGRTIIKLGLGEYVDNSEVTLNFPDASVRYRILQRYRTSMSVSAEGPHLDLVDWRHFDSPWTPLERLGALRFKTLPGDQMEHSRFPTTSRSEIVKAVRRRAGDWPAVLELAKSCRSPHDGACWVGISSMYLRIQKHNRGRWADVGMVELRIPMGC